MFQDRNSITQSFFNMALGQGKSETKEELNNLSPSSVNFFFSFNVDFVILPVNY